MKSGFVKNIILSLAIAAGLLLIVNIVGELAIQPQITVPAVKVEQPMAVKTVKSASVVKTAISSDVTAANGVTSLLYTYDFKAGKKAFGKCLVINPSPWLANRMVRFFIEKMMATSVSVKALTFDQVFSDSEYAQRYINVHNCRISRLPCSKK